MTTKTLTVLGIETSCDETAVAVVNSNTEILSNLVLSQLEEHRIFGGVVPEIAARAHLDYLHDLVGAAMNEAEIRFSSLDAIAATCGPGLIGGVMVGMMTGKAIAAAHNLPFIGVNHLEAHALTPRLAARVPFPYLLLLVSGGHTQLLAVEDVGVYKLFGTTVDDALGECFDKSAKLMGLSYPGGPNLEKAARDCTDRAAACERFSLPRPMKGRQGCDFSFSGLKTAVRTHVEALPSGLLARGDVAALALSFEEAVCDILAERCEKAIFEFLKIYGSTEQPSFVIAGGVAANGAIRATLQGLAARHKMSFVAPPPNLCSDNAAMVAWAGIERFSKGWIDGLDIAARPRWPLDELWQC